MLKKKIKLIFLTLLLFTTLSWSESESLNGILTFEEYNNDSKKSTGMTSFKLINGKETTGYKVGIGSSPYRHKDERVIFKQGCGLSIIDKDGFRNSILSCPPNPNNDILKDYYTNPQLSPNGLFVAVELVKYVNNSFARYSFEYKVLVFDIKGNKISTHYNVFSPTWLPNGRLLLSSSANVYGLFITDKSLKNISKIENHQLREYAYALDVSPSGKRVVFEYNQQIWIMNLNGTGLKRLLRGGKQLKFPTWSPDGKYIAYLKQDSRKYYDDAIYLFEVDGKHREFVLDTNKIFVAGETGYPNIIGPLSWVSSDFSSQKIEEATEIPDIRQVGYTQKNFNDLMELLSFTLGRELTKSEKIAWVVADYNYTQGDFKNRQEKMKKILEKFSAMNEIVQKVKNTTYRKLIQKQMQEYFVLNDKSTPIETSMGTISKLLSKKKRLEIKIQEKNYEMITLEYNKNSAVSNPIGIESLNSEKLKQSSWVKAFYTEHQRKKLSAIKKLKALSTLIPNTQTTGLLETWSHSKKSIVYYAKGENPLPLWKHPIKIKENHYQVNNKTLDIFIKPWGYLLYNDIPVSKAYDDKSAIYLLNTTDIPRGYEYLLNIGYKLNIGFDLKNTSPSDFQREVMSHIKRMQLKIDGDKTPEIKFDLWFDNKEYASAFLTLIKLKKIELKANYAHKTIDEWLLENLAFKQDGKQITLHQTFSSKLSQEFITRVCDEIALFEK